MEQPDKPVIQSFRMRGIHGYKDISIDFEGRARIVIAENGAGKTTILSALYAFLKGDFEHFQRLSFDSIECHFTGSSKPLVLHRSALHQNGDTAQDSRIVEWSRIAGVDPVEIRTMLLGLDPKERFNYSANPLLEYIYLNSPLGPAEISQQAAAMRAEIETTLTEDIKELASAISTAVSQYEILYLPTYRRVELPLSKREANANLRRYGNNSRVRTTSINSKWKWTKHGIQFGLSDVEDRINDIFEQIQRQSNIGYRFISANIIDELLGAQQLRGSQKSLQLPKIEDLRTFFARIQTAGQSDRLDAIQNLYETNSIEDKSNETLKYFLTKLSTVVDQTKELESNIQDFVAKVNDYLKQSSDEKNLVYDAAKMKVQVQNLWTGQHIKLDDLSSGEKQIISILAYFYLDQKMKIVLIDEPELSLSMDWQKRILPDTLSSPTCAQLLAITHSPFIFENALDPFAGPLTIERHHLLPNE